jgi:hypothetical protein
VPEFRLQFPLEEIGAYAARYAYDEDDAVVAAGKAARQRGFYAREELLEVCRWKARGRTDHHAAENTPEEVESITRAAFAEPDERKRIAALRELNGVDWATASVLLHFGFPTRYPILDRRALQALGLVAPAAYSFKYWRAYVEFCRRLASEAGVDMRTLDRALWQYSKEHGVPIY